MKPVLGGAELAHDPLWIRAALDPRGVAVLYEGQRITWSELKDNVCRAAGMLRDLGIGAGSRVGLLARNSPLFIELTLAAGAMGAALTAINWRLTGPEVRFIATDSELEVLFVESEFASIAPSAGDAGSLKRVVPADYGDYRASADRYPARPIDSTALTGDETVLVLYSSGTTGHPKGVTIPHRSLLWRAKQTEAELLEAGGPPHIAVLVPMPMFHIAGLGATLFSLALGRRVNLLREAKLERIVDAIDQGDNQTFLAPTVLQTILDAGGPAKKTIGKLRELRYGSSPMPLALLDRVLREWPDVEFSQAYGLTETAGGIVELTDEIHRHRDSDDVLRSAGKPMSGVEVKIVDPDRLEELPSGAAGEIWVRCPFLATGYYGNPEATAAAFTPDGWLRTGDIGELSADGYLFVRDRLKDMIISGGENIYSSEVELVISRFPGVNAVAVIGVPDEKWGERPVACLEVDDADAFDTDRLREFCGERLASFKRPDQYVIVPSLPRNAVGKILKHELRAGRT